MACIDAETSRLWEQEKWGNNMGCSDWGQVAYEARKEAERKAEIIPELEAMLCSACRQLESDAYDFDLNPMLSRWWDNHKKEDAKRVAAETKQALAIAQCEELAAKPFNTLTAADKKFLKANGYL